MHEKAPRPPEQRPVDRRERAARERPLALAARGARIRSGIRRQGTGERGHRKTGDRSTIYGRAHLAVVRDRRVAVLEVREEHDPGTPWNQPAACRSTCEGWGGGGRGRGQAHQLCAHCVGHAGGGGQRRVRERAGWRGALTSHGRT